jgi:hypothetical protein
VPTLQPANEKIDRRSNVRQVMAELDGGSRRSAELSDTQVLQILEGRQAGGVDAAPADSSIQVLKPEDTGLRRALRAAVESRQPVPFAVQLVWSVQPIDMSAVPPLAIFSAYTLYTVEGSRGGRRWYGLRLGFFSDANSAKQVAQYVRSEFSSVAVVPVSQKERDFATDEITRVAREEKKAAPPPSLEIELIRETPPVAASAAAVDAERRSRANNPVKPSRDAAPRSKPAVRTRKPAQTLEETLEILGASELGIDNATEITLNGGVRHLMVERQKSSPLAALLTRLAERARKS